MPLTKTVTLTVRVNEDLQPQEECIPVGCVPSAAVAVSWGGVYLVPGGTWSGGGTWSRGVPGPRGGGYSWSQGRVYLVWGAPGPGGVPGPGGHLVPGGCTWSRGGAPGPGGVPHQIHPRTRCTPPGPGTPPLWTDTRL